MEKEVVISQALALTEKGRAEVATRLLESLGAPGEPVTDEEPLVEARLRSEEMDKDPESALTHDQFVEQVTKGRS